jgi:hypothetical protein
MTEDNIELNLPFFINLLYKLRTKEPIMIKSSQEKWSLSVHNSLLEGITSNPNLQRKQFLKLFKRNPYEIHHQFLNFTTSHQEAEDLKWIWKLAKEQEMTSLTSWWVGQDILKQHSKNAALQKDVIEYFLGLEEINLIYNKETRKKIPSLNFGFFLEFMIANTSDMDTYDEYVNLYTAYTKRNKAPEYKWFYTISSNQNIDEERIKNILIESKNLFEEARIRVLSNLLSCSNIPVNLFNEILEKKKTIKEKVLINELYEGAARNQSHIHWYIETLLKYLKRGRKEIKPHIFNIFEVLVSNKSISKEELDDVIEIIQTKGTELHWYWKSSYKNLSRTIARCLERQNLSKEQITRIIDLYFDFIDEIDQNWKKAESYNRPEVMDVFSEANILTEQIDLVIERLKGRVLEYPTLATLAINKNLTNEQYLFVHNVLKRNYFGKGNSFQVTEYPFLDIRAPHFVLHKWASSRFVAN